MNSKFWGSDEINVLQEMTAAGCTIDEINTVIPYRSRDAILKKMSSLGIKYRAAGQEIDMEAFKRIMKGRK